MKIIKKIETIKILNDVKKNLKNNIENVNNFFIYKNILIFTAVFLLLLIINIFHTKKNMPHMDNTKINYSKMEYKKVLEENKKLKKDLIYNKIKFKKYKNVVFSLQEINLREDVINSFLKTIFGNNPPCIETGKEKNYRYINVYTLNYQCNSYLDSLKFKAIINYLNKEYFKGLKSIVIDKDQNNVYISFFKH